MYNDKEVIDGIAVANLHSLCELADSDEEERGLLDLFLEACFIV